MQKMFEETALNSPSETDAPAFLWTFNCLDDDHELERFFVGLPGFRSSKVVKDPLPSLAEEGKKKLFEALIGLLDHTILSELLPELVKSQRAMMCKKVINQVHVPFHVIHLFFFPNTTLNVQATMSMIVATVQPHDDPWFLFASKSLGVPQAILQDHIAHGDSLSLAILIHITHQ